MASRGMEERYPSACGHARSRLAVRQLCRFLGDADPFAHEITFDEAERFYNTLKWMPKSMTAKMAARPPTEIANEMQSGVMKRQRTAGGTATKKIQLLSAMFSYAVTRG